MSTLQSVASSAAGELRSAVETACNTIAPCWPLDRAIAVNPHWGRIDHPFATVSQTLGRLTGTGLQMPMAFYREAWRNGDITLAHLRAAIAEADQAVCENAMLDALDAAEPERQALPLLSDVLDASRDRTHEPAWRDVIVCQISQFCAAFFDRDQADWHPPRDHGLYACWLQGISDDSSVALLMHAPEIRRRATGLPRDALGLIALACERLAMSPADLPVFLQLSLLRVNGWAAWCAYLRWQAHLAGAKDEHMVDLLAVRLAWELLIDDGVRTPSSIWHEWRQQRDAVQAACGSVTADAAAVWQRAQEVAYQWSLVNALTRNTPSVRRNGVEVQAAFCIDVRSEVFRRALEGVSSAVQTLGCAGFFGLPIAYAPIGSDVTRPQLPGLLAPSLTVIDSCGQPAQDHSIARARQARLARMASWVPFKRLPASAFTLVESLGLAYLGTLVRRSLPSAADGAHLDRLALTPAQLRQVQPALVGDDVQLFGQKVALAASMLRAMGLVEGFARLVLLIGHGSQSANNPLAASLDCGACGGQTGEVNARLLAGLLNDVAVRDALVGQSIQIPATTLFLAALHNTTTDEVVVLDRHRVPASYSEDVDRAESRLAAAGEVARRERAPKLGLTHLAAQPRALHKAIKARANDWAQTRPEWGLANNAAFIVAPRWRTSGTDLEGRVFLHDYDHRQDFDGSVLEMIMTAPMIVTHWINMQYHASTVDNLRFGSGNKILHNVVGGRIGVFEGNGGDLRIGLPHQSIHDGARYMHTPLRLSVFIEAPQANIDAVIAKHEVVRRLLDNQWLYVFRIDPEQHQVSAYRDAVWRAIQCPHGQGTDEEGNFASGLHGLHAAQ